ncbi:MAG: hypothetical protein Q8N73_01850 [bacterium]|nr:hypothetical protein [bacterium]
MEMKLRVYDLDGVLTQIGRYNPDIKLPWWVFLGLIFVKPNKKIVSFLKNLDERNIIIVSARPWQLKRLTELWLRFHKIPCHNLFCVGLGKDAKKRKLRVIERVIKQMKMKVEEVIDDNQPTVEYLKKHGINARLP